MGPEMSDHSLELAGQSEHTLRYAPIWRESPKAVVSRTLTEAGWNTRVFDGSVVMLRYQR